MGSKGRRKGGKYAKGRKGANTLSRTSTARDTPFASPIHGLAPEILVAIFSQALLEQVSVDYRRASWNMIVPMNISAVCHQWRAIVLASPTLWSTIKGLEEIGKASFLAETRDIWGRCNYYAWKHFNLFLRRSGLAPLDISMTLTEPSQANVDSLLSALYDNQTRLRNIDISLNNNYGSGPHGLNPYWTLPDLPIIEDFRLQWRSRLSIFLKLKNAPFLRRLKLDGLRGVSSINADLVLPNLVNVELSNTRIHVHDWIMLSQAFQSIEEFSASTVSIIGNDRHPDLNPDGISTRLSMVSVFSLTNIAPKVARFILGTLTLPGVKKLVIRIGYGFEPSIHIEEVFEPSTSGVHSLIERSNAVLETLDLSIPNLSELVQCLKSSPDLRTLRLSVGHGGEIDDLVERLILYPGVRMCPRLRKIAFSYCCFNKIEAKVYVMVCSWWGGNSLEAVEFHECARGQAVGLLLEEHCKGLDIVVTFEDNKSDQDSDYDDADDSDYNHDGWVGELDSDHDSCSSDFSD